MQVVSPGSDLFERLVRDAGGASSVAAFRSVLLDGLQRLVGADSASMMDPPWVDIDDERARERTVGLGLSAEFAGPFLSERRRYVGSMAKLLRAVRVGGPVLDTEVYGADERRRLALYREILVPQRSTSMLAAAVHTRGAATAMVAFKRHGRSSSFRARDAAALEAVLPAMALADAGFRYALEAQRMGGPCATLALTPRETQVAELASRGLRNTEIAALLGTSAETVKKQLRNVFGKAQVSNRTELAMLWTTRHG
jgi:DNA-binding CsgD family transcriptional regulator